MKIALFGHAEHTIPPKLKGIFAPLFVVQNLANGLVKRNHQVTLFAPKGSKSLAKLVDFNMESFDNIREKRNLNWEIKSLIAYEQEMISQVYQYINKENFDIFHSHDALRTLPFVDFSSVPTVFTLHTKVEETYQIAYETASKLKSKFYPISISKAQQKNFQKLNWFDNVYNGIDLNAFDFSEKGGKDLIWVGRIHPGKGTDIAIEVAKKAGYNLKLAGDYCKEDNESKSYWEVKIKNLIDNRQISHLGLVAYSDMYRVYQNAKALLFPIQWDEPFGLVMIEAMACGTPVIAFDRGSVSEIIKDGETGFIIKPNDIDGMVEAVKKVDQIDRAACRKHVEENFSVEKMVEGYEKVYQKILSQTRNKT